MVVMELRDDEVLAIVQSTVYAIWEARNHTGFQQRDSMVDNVL